jgi:carboxyvinyl-carboxyphosphonate phosphorylmutase
MTWTDRREKFRAILAGSRCVFPATVFDPLSARMAVDLGFEAGVFAGSVASLVVLGAPDIVLLTLSEFVEQAHRTTRAVSLPIVADADHGYGNALNVMRTVEELEAAGISALSIEDTLLPMPYGAQGKSKLIPLEEGVGKMRAAVAARRDKSLAIFARTSALADTGTEDAVKRFSAYAKTGVDGIFVIGAKTREQIDAVAAAVKLPMILGPVPPGLADADYLSQKGFRLHILGHAAFFAGLKGFYEALKAIRAGTPVKDIPVPPHDLIQRLTRAEEYRRQTHDFLGGDQGHRD